jgi:transposase
MGDAENVLPSILCKLLNKLNDHLKELDHRVEELGLRIKLWHKANEASQKLETIGSMAGTGA